MKATFCTDWQKERSQTRSKRLVGSIGREFWTIVPVVMGDNIGREGGCWFENVHHSQAKCLFLCFSENIEELQWKNTKEKLLFRRGQMPILGKVVRKSHFWKQRYRTLISDGCLKMCTTPKRNADFYVFVKRNPSYTQKAWRKSCYFVEAKCPFAEKSVT